MNKIPQLAAILAIALASASAYSAGINFDGFQARKECQAMLSKGEAVQGTACLARLQTAVSILREVKTEVPKDSVYRVCIPDEKTWNDLAQDVVDSVDRDSKLMPQLVGATSTPGTVVSALSKKYRCP